jgi:hypothetical protein
VRSFARIGQNIWKRLLERRGISTKALLELQRTADQSLQVVRHGAMLPFPWHTIYDYGLPAGDAFRTARICFADTASVRPLAEAETGCPHHPGEDFICIEGFWSVRHRLEQITEERDAGEDDAEGQERVTAILVPSGNPLVCLGVGNDDLPARDLERRLREALGSNLRVLTDADEMIDDLLWNAGSRPGLLVILSHLQPADPQSNLPARISATVSKPPYRPNVISETLLLQKKLHRHTWSAPRSFVMLMACKSARVQLSDLTNLVDTFFGVGAAAVAGTESDVISDLAADFAAHLALGLTAGGLSLGESVRGYMTSMLRKRNPLPFAFTVFGSGNLSIGRA